MAALAATANGNRPPSTRGRAWRPLGDRASVKQIAQGERDRRNIGDDHARQISTTRTKCASERVMRSSEMPATAQAANRLTPKERRDHAEREINHHHQSEMHRVDAELHGDRRDRIGASTMIEAEVSMNIR